MMARLWGWWKRRCDIRSERWANHLCMRCGIPIPPDSVAVECWAELRRCKKQYDTIEAKQ